MRSHTIIELTRCRALRVAPTGGCWLAMVDVWGLELGDHRGLWQALFDLGWASFYVDDDRTAIGSFKECLEISERMDEPALVNPAQLGIVPILVSMGELDGAPELGAQAIELSRSPGDPWAQHFAYHFRADRALILDDDPSVQIRMSAPLPARELAGSA